jgi:hypothetical protein
MGIRSGFQHLCERHPAGEYAMAEPRVTRVLVAVAFCLVLMLGATGHAAAFFTSPKHPTLFAIDPDVVIRKIDPSAPSRMWVIGQGWGMPPFFYRSRVQGLYDRWDFLYPLGCKEESQFRSRSRFTPFVDTQWYKVPPYDGHSRYLTAFWGRADDGQNYWGIFPFYGYTHRRSGADDTRFVLFPLYYESNYDQEHTIRILWPLVTYAKSPGRNAFKVWPLYGKDLVTNRYANTFFLWPFFQQIDKYPGTEQHYSYTAAPFPLYMRTETKCATTTDFLWPFISYYKDARGHRKYSVRPIFSYGTGGGIEELNIFYVYTSKKDRRKGTSESSTESSGGYISVGDDEVFTEKKFLMMSSIQKRYSKGCLVYAKYKFWPFAEYSWDLNKGTHLKVPELTGIKNDWWDLNWGRLLSLIDIRDTPITREISYLFGLSQETKFKAIPYVQHPPKPGDDSWSELLAGSFGQR